MRTCGKGSRTKGDLQMTSGSHVSSDGHGQCAQKNHWCATPRENLSRSRKMPQPACDAPISMLTVAINVYRLLTGSPLVITDFETWQAISHAPARGRERRRRREGVVEGHRGFLSRPSHLPRSSALPPRPERSGDRRGGGAILTPPPSLLRRTKPAGRRRWTSWAAGDPGAGAARPWI